MQEFLTRVDSIARRFGFYTAYELPREEYMGTVQTIDDHGHGYLRYALETQMGYEPSPRLFGVPLEAAKTHPETGEVHDYSFRKVDSESPRWQWHIHIYENGAESEIFSHYEMRPDFCLIDGETLSEAKHRLRTHLSPEWGTDYLKGVACEEIVALTE